MSETPVPITYGTGQASIAGDLAGGNIYQQIKVYDGTLGSTAALIVNADGTANVRISGSVLTAGGTFTGSVSGTVGASIIGTVPVVQSGTVITSISGTIPVTLSGNPSISGTVNIGNFPATQPVSGSVTALQGTNPWIITGSVQGTFAGGNSSTITVVQSSIAAVIIGGSIAASFTPPANQSVSGTVLVNQGTTPWIVTGSVQGSFSPSGNQSVSGTVGASIIGQVPVVIIGGSIAASFTPPANQSVSGAVSVSNFPTTQNVSGSVVSFQGTTPWVITGSIQGTLTPAANQSVSGTVNVGNFPTTQNVSGSVVAFQGTTPFIITGSIQGTFNSPANQSVSGTVGASIIGTVPFTQAGTLIASVFGNMSVLGTVPVTQATTPWVITGSVQGVFTGNQSVSGAVNVASIVSIPGYLSAANSSTSLLSGGSLFTGTSEDIKDFSAIAVNVFSDQTSATDGLSMQQSSNGTNWDITDVYTIAASTGKTFSVQPAARFFRVVYTNGATPQGTFRLQTIYHVTNIKPSSQRTSDAYTNETDLEQNWSFNSFWNGATWDRMRGNSTNGLIVQSGNASVLTLSQGSIITVWQSPSIVGTYAEDAPSSSGDKGFLVMGARNDTLSSVTSNDGDYSSHVVGPAGELIAENAPLTKWVSGTNSMLGGIPLTSSVIVIAAQGASIFTYITGVQIANLSASSVLVGFYGATSSLIGYTIAPAGGGSNVYYENGLKTSANGAFSASVSGTASIYVSAQGFISKT